MQPTPYKRGGWKRLGPFRTCAGETAFRRPVRIKSGEFIVTDPRLPCYKLGIKMEHDEFAAKFLKRGLLRCYLAVTKEGEIGGGDEVVELSRDPNGFRVTEIAQPYARDRADVGRTYNGAVALDVVPDSWGSYFRERLSRLERCH